jgi:hypothetical protein
MFDMLKAQDLAVFSKKIQKSAANITRKRQELVYM